MCTCTCACIHVHVCSPYMQVKARKSVFGPPVSRVGTGHLVHPGAVLCMVDLLPSVSMPPQLVTEDELEEEVCLSVCVCVCLRRVQTHFGIWTVSCPHLCEWPKSYNL